MSHSFFEKEKNNYKSIYSFLPSLKRVLKIITTLPSVVKNMVVYFTSIFLTRKGSVVITFKNRFKEGKKK